MIGISSYLFYPGGGRTFPELPQSTLRNQSRRLSKIPTLDGGVFINDLGFADGDRSFVISVELNDEEDYTFFATMMSLYPRVTITTPDGAFDAYLSDISVSDGLASVTVEAKSKVSS